MALCRLPSEGCGGLPGQNLHSPWLRSTEGACRAQDLWCPQGFGLRSLMDTKAGRAVPLQKSPLSRRTALGQQRGAGLQGGVCLRKQCPAGPQAAAPSLPPHPPPTFKCTQGSQAAVPEAAGGGGWGVVVKAGSAFREKTSHAGCSCRSSPKKQSPPQTCVPSQAEINSH